MQLTATIELLPCWWSTDWEQQVKAVQQAPQNVENEYLKSLDSKMTQRYKDKFGIINNLDPYTLKRKELNENIELYPAVTYPDMVDYFLFALSPLTSDELKCYKSLQSYNNCIQD